MTKKLRCKVGLHKWMKHWSARHYNSDGFQAWVYGGLVVAVIAAFAVLTISFESPDTFLAAALSAIFAPIGLGFAGGMYWSALVLGY